MRSARLLLAALLGIAAACSGPGSNKAPSLKSPERAEPVSDEDWNAAKAPRPRGEPLGFRFVDFRSERRLGLLNESHTDPAEFYSQRKKLEESMTKVGHDDVVGALLERFEEHGWFKLAQPGPMPAAGAGVWTMALELERKGVTTHMALGAGSSAKEREVFGACRNDFVLLYSNVLGLQSVERAPEWQTQKPTGIPPKH